MEFIRAASLPVESFFLFGPRGTGKSTWLRKSFPTAKTFNLLLTKEYLRLSRSPELFRAEVEALPRKSWVVIDEVQRLPSLLNEVHALLEDHPGSYRFALTGSSARKLKRDEANLLAGRAITRGFFPLTRKELGAHFNLNRALRYGCLPRVWSHPESPKGLPSEIQVQEYLESFAETYLREEIQQEALVRNLDSFSRFLEVAAIANGQILNISNVSRDCHVARQTVHGFYDVLEETLLGIRLPAWRPRLKVKEVEHPKFYFFDGGVARTLLGKIAEPPESAEEGVLLESFLLNELRAFDSYAGLKGKFSYWRTPSGSEIDLIWTKGSRSVGFEFKRTTRWRREDSASLLEVVQSGKLKRGFAVYLGKETLALGKNVVALPIEAFLEKLAQGKVID